MRMQLRLLVMVTVAIGCSGSAWAGERQRLMRQQIRADQQYRRETRQNLRSANQDVRAATKDINQQIRSGEFGPGLTGKRKQEIRRTATYEARQNRFNAKMDNRYAKGLVNADKRVLGVLRGQPPQRPSGEWKKVAPAQSKWARQTIRGWIRVDKGYVKNARANVGESRTALQAAIAGGDKQAINEARKQLRFDKTQLRWEKAIRSGHQNQLKRAQGFGRVIEGSGH